MAPHPALVPQSLSPHPHPLPVVHGRPHLPPLLQESEAEALYRAALDVCRASLGLAQELTLISLTNPGCRLPPSGEHPELATVCLREGRKGSEKLYGDGHIEMLIARGNLGSCLFRQGKAEEAAGFLYDVYMYDGVARVKKTCVRRLLPPVRAPSYPPCARPPTPLALCLRPVPLRCGIALLCPT